MNDLLEMWQAHVAINIYLLQNLPEGGLDAIPNSDGMQVRQIFAHINDLRLRWMHGAAPDLAIDLAWFEKQPDLAPDASQLAQALEHSGEAVAALIRRSTQAGARINGFPGPVAAFLGYLISHESYHWGEIGIALSQSGTPLSKEAALGIWKGWWGRAITTTD